MNWSEFFAYDPETGVLSWRVKRPGPKTAIGQEAGSVKHDGRYRSFMLFHKRYYTHRVIWELVHGPITKGLCIDHLDGNGLNNRLDNLRLTTLSQNQRNRRLSKNSRTGVIGVFHHKKGFAVTCAQEYVGHFKTLADATNARKQAEAQMGFHPTHGRKSNASHP